MYIFLNTLFLLYSSQLLDKFLNKKKKSKKIKIQFDVTQI